MKGIFITGSKGGTGKTSLSHALALGCAWYMKVSYLVHTDFREPLDIRNRPYYYLDGREPDTLQSLIAEAIKEEEGFFLIDGGGNRSHITNWLAKSMDLFLIPVLLNQEDINIAKVHAEELRESGAKNIMFIINQYPSNKFERVYVKKYIEQLPENMILGKIGSTRSIRVLTDNDEGDFLTPPAKVNNLARNIYRMVNGYLKEC